MAIVHLDLWSRWTNNEKLKISHVSTIPKYNLKVVRTEAKPIPLTHLYITTQTLLAWIKGGRVQVCSTCEKLTTLQRNWGWEFSGKIPDFSRGCHSRDVVVVGFSFTYTIRSCNHQGCEFDPCHDKVYSIPLYVWSLSGWWIPMDTAVSSTKTNMIPRILLKWCCEWLYTALILIPKSLTMSNDLTYFCFTLLWFYCQYLYNYIFPDFFRRSIK
jgi:hypothetical protein